MKTLKNKMAAITIAIFFILSMTASLTLIPNANAHTPPWNIPTYAYISLSPNPVGVGQSVIVYMWLDCVYGAAGGTSAAVGTNGYTSSAALLSNDYRFHNYQLTITAPDGTKTAQTFSVVSDPTSDQSTTFTPTQVGTYNFSFSFPGQVYGANGDGYSASSVVNDTYMASSASATLSVQQTPIPSQTIVEPLPTAFWETPIYGENANWYAISSNWLGSGSPTLSGYTVNSGSYQLYHPDAIGPTTSHIMWTSQLQFGGVVGGNMYPAGGSDPNGAGTGVSYFEGSSYQPRFNNPIIVDGYLFYTETVSFSGGSSGPTVCVNLETGQQLWSSTTVPQLSFAYIYNLWDPDQHGVYPPILVATNPVTGNWQLYDAYTGDSLFNVTSVPSGTAVAGPSGEQLRYVIANDGTAANPQWYLAEWNSSKLWQYDINPYTGTGSLSPAVINETNSYLIGGAVGSSSAPGAIPPPNTGVNSATSPAGKTVSVPADSTILVNANIPIHDTADLPGTTTPIYEFNQDSLTTYDWNVSIPWLNTMPVQPTYNSATGTYTPAAAGTNPVSVVAASYGDLMLCRNGSLPTGFAADDTGSFDLPYTMFAINLNASRGAIGSILWMKTYNPPTGNVTLQLPVVDFQTGVFAYQYYETVQWVGFSLTNGDPLWGPTQPEVAFNYYDWSGYDPGVMAYGNLYNGGFGGVTYCFNDVTGALEWTWGNGAPGSDNSTYAGLNTPYGVYPTFIQSVSNGIVYLATDEHTIPNPLYQGATYDALNATTGQMIWQLSGYPSEWAYSGSEWATADGYLTAMNGYNNQIYSIGRGPSKITVTAPDVGITTATPITITGTVIDISAGTTQSQQAADFPNGVPCASDASMMAWMGYVYQQQPEPTNFTGVQVTLSVIDANGNHRVIGTTTTNEQGEYGFNWTPDIPGNYTLYAAFAGTNAYYGSTASTYFYASSPAATPAPTASPISGLASTSTVMYIGVAIIIVIIIIGAAILLAVTRKHP